MAVAIQSGYKYSGRVAVGGLSPPSSLQVGVIMIKTLYEDI